MVAHIQSLEELKPGQFTFPRMVRGKGAWGFEYWVRTKELNFPQRHAGIWTEVLHETTDLRDRYGFEGVFLDDEETTVTPTPAGQGQKKKQ